MWEIVEELATTSDKEVIVFYWMLPGAGMAEQEAEEVQHALKTSQTRPPR